MNLKTLPQRLEAGIGAFAARNYRRPALALLIVAVLSAVGVFFAGRLKLNADLTSLLPQSFESVQDLDKLRLRFGGMGYVVVAGMDADPEALKRFATDVAPELEKLAEIRYVDVQRSSDFFEERALYYMELQDVETLRDRLKARVNYERRKRNPMFVSLDDTEEVPSLDFSDLEQKYAGSTRTRMAGNAEKFYLDPAQRMVVILCKPKGNAADLGYSRKVVGQVQELLDAKAKSGAFSKYGPEFKTAITGTYKKKVDQQIEITHDLRNASLLAAGLLLLYLAFHFRSLLAVAFTLLPVSAALMWTYGFVALAFKDVNLLTGFLGAILGGLGVEHGIHLYGRFTALRHEGLDGESAVREAFAHTGFSALVSAVVAALTFLSLAISEFGAFREFGIIAAVGLLLAVLSYVLLMPALLALATRAGWKGRVSSAVEGRTSETARLLPRIYRPVGLVVGLGLVTLVAFMPKARFNYDFSALDDVTIESVKLDKRIDPILGYSQSPVIVLTDTPAQEREVVQKLLARKAERGAESTIDFVGALEDLVPLQQPEKQAVLQDIGKMLEKVSGEDLDPEARAQFDRAKRLTAAQPFTRADLPTAVRRQFEGYGNDQSGFVLVFSKVSLADGAGVRRFAREVRGIELSSGTRVSAAGEAMILADILEMVTREAPEILLAAIISVLAAMWLTMGRLRTALVCMLPTVLSIMALVGLMAITGVNFNYLNIIVIPVLIGTTVDAGVHLLGRLSEKGVDFTPTYAETARSIVGGLLTSAVGFGAMVLARHPGLNSIGDLANLGFAVNLVVVLLAFPSLLLWLQRRRQPAAASSVAEAAGVERTAEAAEEPPARRAEASSP